MTRSVNDCYTRAPLSIEDGVPIFSETDFYVENYDRIADDHLMHFEATGHNPFMREDHWEEIEKSTEVLINKYAPHPGVKILDVGVGMGRLLERFPKLSRFGMDISRGYLKYAQKKGIEVCMSRIEDMPYMDGCFDIVVTTDVLEHVLDLNVALSKIMRVLKEGGVLIVRVPYKEDLKGYLHPDYPYDLVHLRNFDENNLRILFEKIFNVEVLEWTLAGYKSGRLKVGAGVRCYAGITRRLLNIVRRLDGGTYSYLARRLLEPTEINMVIRNAKYGVKRL